MPLRFNPLKAPLFASFSARMKLSIWKDYLFAEKAHYFAFIERFFGFLFHLFFKANWVISKYNQ